MSPPLAAAGHHDLLHPSFLPPCEHGRDEGNMHAHAFDLLSFAGASPASSISHMSGTPPPSHAVPASVPSRPSVLSATRPPTINGPSATVASANVAGFATKPRRMSSSTTGVLGRGKLGLMGAEGGLGLIGTGKDSRISLPHATSYSGSAPMTNRLPGAGPGTSPTPQLYDFAKTDRRPRSHQRPPTNGARAASVTVPASLPTRSHLHAQGHHIHPPPIDDVELDMEFDADEEDEEGFGDAEMDLDIDDDGEVDGDLKVLALGTGSGGLKGKRKGMVFKCEHCGKQYRHPSCLVKHRWEHSPHWKEPTALSMSKHQQVQMLEAAAILAYLHPNQQQGRALPLDKSLWPAILSPPGEPAAQLRKVSREHPSIRSPSSSGPAPLTPASLREPMNLSNAKDRRKSSPGSDSTTSSMGEVVPSAAGIGIRNGYPDGRQSRPMGIEANRATSSSLSSVPGPGTPQSVGSLPDMSHLNVQKTGTSVNYGVSPIPNRGIVPMSLSARTGLIGGGMFAGGINHAPAESSLRSGARNVSEDNEAQAAAKKRSGKSSSEEAEERRKSRDGEEWGMAMDMEL